jgi:hypothetical protein
MKIRLAAVMVSLVVTGQGCSDGDGGGAGVDGAAAGGSDGASLPDGAQAGDDAETEGGSDAAPGADAVTADSATGAPDASDPATGTDGGLSGSDTSTPGGSDTSTGGGADASEPSACADLGDADGDGVCDPSDICPTGPDNADADADKIPDACDACPEDSAYSTFNWVRWTTSVGGSSIDGMVGRVPVTYESSSPIESTSYVYDHFQFPTSYRVPNVDPTIKNVQATANRLRFSRPVSAPLLVFASVGRSGQDVTVRFDRPIEVLFQLNLSNSGTDFITGHEGYAVVRVPGVHDQIGFEYTAAEHWANFVFGFGGRFDNTDTDGDGVPDICDPCPLSNPDDANGDGACDPATR